jgi:hypothetical protein
MRLVVDANVVVQLQISGGQLGPLSGHELVGPPLVMAEATSSIREQVYRGGIPPDRGRGFIEGLAELPITIVEPSNATRRESCRPGDHADRAATRLIGVGRASVVAGP